MKLKKKDFIEIDFTAKFKDSGEVFDSSLKSELQKLNPNAIAKPFIFSLGQNMFLKGVDNFLIGKTIEKFPIDYKIELTPKNAFGLRDPKLVQMIPMKVFKEHNINPLPGVSLNFDGKIAKILTVSGGRTMVDFNNPLAGKELVYEIKILRKIDDLNEKIRAFNDFLFKKDLKFKTENKKLILEVEKGLKSLIELFKDKYKDVLGLELEVKENIQEKQGKKENLKENKETEAEIK